MPFVKQTFWGFKIFFWSRGVRLEFSYLSYMKRNLSET